MTSGIRESPYEPGCYFVGDQQWRIPARYRLLKVLGSGSFSFVCLAHDSEADEKVAIKFIPDVTSSAEYVKRVLREVCILRRVSHPGIIQLKGAFVQPSSTGPKRCVGGKLVASSIDLYVVVEYVDGGDLFSMKGQMSEADVKLLLFQLLAVVKYLHSINVWHRDLKSANVLSTYSQGCRMIKVCDFGSARSKTLRDSVPAPAPTPYSELTKKRRLHHDSSLSSVEDTCAADLTVRMGEGGMRTPLTRTVATPCYRAPEVIMSRGSYSSAIDMWSIGCIFAELLQRIVRPGSNITPSLQIAPLFSVTWGGQLTPKEGDRFSDSSPGNAAIHHELETLFNVVGTPAWACIDTVPSDAWRAYLRKLPGRAPKLHRRFSQAGEPAIDLLARLLTFEPSRRASADEALSHEYLSELVRVASVHSRSASMDGASMSAAVAVPAQGPMDAEAWDASGRPSSMPERPSSSLLEDAAAQESAAAMEEAEEGAGLADPKVVVDQFCSFSLSRHDSPARPRDLHISTISDHWEESDPARALELLEESIQNIVTSGGTEKEQCQALRVMLEAEVNGIGERGVAASPACARTTSRYLAPGIHRSLSLTDIKQEGLQVDDGGRQIDSSQIARGRLNRSADITTAHLNTEDYLASGRHGEWAGGSAARWVGQGGWGSSVLPPGMKGGSKEAATYLNAISAQQRR